MQATASKTTQAGSASLAFSAATNAGDVILIGFNFDQSVTPSSVTDSQGNVYTEVGTQLTTPGGVHGRVYYAKNIVGGPDTVTVNLSGQADFLEMYLTEYSGADPNNPIDAQAGGTGTTGAASSGNATTTASGDIVYGYCVSDAACTVGSGFTARSTLVENLTEDEIVGNAGSYAATGTSNSGWLMQMVALRPGSGTAGAAPAITSATAANGTVGTAFSYQIAATNSPTSYGATGLPAGLSVNTNTGLISGTPTAAGTSNVTLSAANSAGTGNATLTLTVATAPPVITSPSSASGTTGVGFTYQITATNSPTTYNASGLPDGLIVNTTNGLISGTPMASGISTVTVSATNGTGTGNASVTLTISLGPPVVTSSTSVSAAIGSAFSYQITATNSPTSYGATGLPTGLSVDTTTGIISGTPSAAGSSTVTISATNGTGTGTAPLDLTITATPYFVQATANKTTQTPSASLAFSADTKAGDVILIGFNFDQSVAPSSVTDSEGNVYTEVGTQLTTPGGVHGRVYYARNIAGGPDTVTVSLDGQTDFLEMYLTEYSGADPNNPVDAQAGATGTAGAVSSGNATTTASGDVVYGYCVADAACTVGSGFTARSTLVENLTEDEIVGDAGSYAATGTSNSGWLMQMVALRPGSGTVGAAPAITSSTAANGTVGTAFSYQIAATNSPTSYGATGLPAGLSVNTSTGLISGTPTAAGTSNVTLSAANSAGTGNGTLTLTIANVAQAELSITPSSVAFGNVSVGSNSSKTVTLTNTGNATLNITAASISGAGYTMSLQPTSINAGANATFTVTFTPTASGSASGNILITSDAPGSPATIVLSGAGVQAQISATPSSVAFGTVIVGNTNSQPITLKNNGNMTLTFSQISVTGARFGQTGLSTSTTIAAGGSTAFNATFDPSSSGTLSGSITLTTNGTPSPLVINLSGTGQASSLLLGASPTSLAFGNVLDQSSKQMTTSVTNNGNANVTISGLTMVGVGFSASGIVNGTILTPGQSATLTVTFAPTSGGARSGSVGIASNATNSPATISLSGTGMHSVLLTWSASPTGGVTYNVFRGSSSGGEGTTPINAAPITTLTFTDANVTPGTTYYYTVEAVDSGGSSAPSNEASAAIPNP